MKNLLHRATAFSLAICMAVTLLFTGVVCTASAEETDFDVMLGRLETLEQLAKEYHADNPRSDSVNLLVLSYIRSARYSSTVWNLAAGTADEKFISYVAEKSPDTVNLRNMGLLTLPNGDSTDITHMFAVINMNASKNIFLPNRGDLGGWMGDTCELAGDIQNAASGLDALTEVAKSRFRVSGSFDEQDWIADLDGYNLYKMKSGSETWAACLIRYFTPTLTEKQRVGKFVQSNLGSIYTSTTVTQSKYRSAVEDKYNTTEIALLWRSRHDTDFNGKLDYHKAACYAVADYLFDTVHAAAPDETSYSIDFVNEQIWLAAEFEANAAESFKGAAYVTGSDVTPGTTVYVRGKRDTNNGAFIPSGAISVDIPARPDTPAMPAFAEATANSLSFSSVEGMEYSIDGGGTWQDNGTFEGLTPHTEYSVICRVKATETCFASEQSAACKASTPLPEGVYVDDTGIYLADDGKIRCMMVAAYQGGRMVSVHAAELNSGVWSSPVPDDAEIDSIRVFALDEHFLPLIEAYSVELKSL